MGRALGAGEARRIVSAEYIVQLYQERAQSENWVLWVNENLEGDKILNQAMLAAKDEGYGK